MKKVALSLLIGLMFTGSAVVTNTQAQDTTQPAMNLAGNPAGSALGDVFRSRLAGIELNPPIDGTIMRELNSGEVVRFVYADTGWDVRVKQIPSHVPLKLSAPSTAVEPGVLEMTATQLTLSNTTAVILRQDVIHVNGKPVGLIEARYNAGTDTIFAQQAIFCENPDKDQHFLVVQMNSRCTPRGQPSNAVDPLESAARVTFQNVLKTVKLLDRKQFFDEQVTRQQNTIALWMSINQKKITESMQPLHFMRVIRSGKDIGFVQINERLATRSGKEGVEVIVRSRVENAPAAPVALPARAQLGEGQVVPEPAAPANAAANQPAAITNLYTNSTFFVSYDRGHEDWASHSQIDDRAAEQLIEWGYSDMSSKIDPRRVRELMKHQPPAGQPQPSVRSPEYKLDVSYEHGVLKFGKVKREPEKPLDFGLPPFYLPQALGQMLPRLLPPEPKLYMFGFYVAGERKQMYRYIDVMPETEVMLDGQNVHAIAISDRIGADGIPTIHYVTRKGEWLGSVNSSQNVTVLPTDPGTLENIWAKHPPGFAIAQEPPVTSENDPDAALPPAPIDMGPTEGVRVPGGNGR